MSGCNATLTVLADGDPGHSEELTLEVVECERGRSHATGVSHRAGGLDDELVWHDGAPGAKPHTPPRYRAKPDPTFAGWWGVHGPDGEVATYYDDHPDPQRAARAEASRLNHREDTP